MEILQSIILGIVQGVGEFLPISSSAHLIIVPYLFGWAEHTLSFDVALHFGTLIAVAIMFWNDWIQLLKGVFNKVVHKKNSFDNKMFWYLVLATIPGALIGKLCEEQIENIFRNRSYIYIIAIALAVMGIFIFIGDRYAAKKFKGKETQYKELTLKQTFLIGLSQSLAIIPGFSRSGTTILTARLLGVSREGAAKFTFMLSAPIIAGATLLKLPEMITGFNISLVIGIIVSAIVGILCIKFLLKYIKNNDFAIFAYYRIIIAIIVLVKFFIVK
ncbi:MAG: undecaprenyl-diphosphatase UppP [Clostridia bacterium]